MSGLYVVIAIGCIECGVSSEMVGLFSDRTEAERIAEHLNNVASWHEGGQSYYEVFDVPGSMNAVSAEYAVYFAGSES